MVPAMVLANVNLEAVDITVGGSTMGIPSPAYKVSWMLGKIGRWFLRNDLRRLAAANYSQLGLHSFDLMLLIPHLYITNLTLIAQYWHSKILRPIVPLLDPQQLKMVCAQACESRDQH